MKLLVVSPHLPSPTWGSKARSYYILQMLARSHSLDLLAIADPTEIADPAATLPLTSLTRNIWLLPQQEYHSNRLQQFATLLLGKSRTLNDHNTAGFQATIAEKLAADRYDGVFVEFSLSPLPCIPEDVQLIIDEHNIEYELLYRTYKQETSFVRKWYNWWEYRLVKPFEITNCKRANVVLVTSERERLILKSLLPQKVIEVVPNGVDLQIFNGQPASPQSDHLSAMLDLQKPHPATIVFTGSMDYRPNIDAALYFARECWPVIYKQFPDAHWFIVGKNPPPEVSNLAAMRGITVTGTVPDVRPFLAAADVAVIPLRIGSGTRLKILEALAMHKAIVSTSLGAEGLEVASGKHLLIEDQPKAFAQAVVDLLHDPDRRKMLGDRGRELVAQEYSWQHCGDRLLHILEQVG